MRKIKEILRLKFDCELSNRSTGRSRLISHSTVADLISQVPIGQWHQRMGEPTLADAVLDRMVHNSYSINMESESRRKQLAKETKKKMEEIQGGKNK